MTCSLPCKSGTCSFLESYQGDPPEMETSLALTLSLPLPCQKPFIGSLFLPDQINKFKVNMQYKIQLHFRFNICSLNLMLRWPACTLQLQTGSIGPRTSVTFTWLPPLISQDLAKAFSRSHLSQGPFQGPSCVPDPDYLPLKRPQALVGWDHGIIFFPFYLVLEPRTGGWATVRWEMVCGDFGSCLLS